MLEDRLLLWKFKRGSRDAFRAIYEKYAGDMLTLAGNLLDDKVGAEDIVQDVFIKLVESAGTFRLTGSLKSYLATCVANRSRDCVRRRIRRRKAIAKKAEKAPAGIKSAVHLAINSEHLQKLSEALTELPYEQREAIALRIHGNLRFRQIAELQKVSTKTAQSRYSYGLDKLRSTLNGEVIK
ncbi:MAG: RNA polymerase sigma factor [Planctomycetota bacterium]|jgi:RNA polymerase sigma-70 factor (ECF subfamily)